MGIGGSEAADADVTMMPFHFRYKFWNFLLLAVCFGQMVKGCSTEISWLQEMRGVVHL
jgi:hypothetical protein